MNEIARLLIGVGGVLLILGLLFLWLGKFPGVGRLPGDILIKKENFTFYFPVTSGILLSLILSLVLFVLNRR